MPRKVSEEDRRRVVYLVEAHGVFTPDEVTDSWIIEALLVLERMEKALEDFERLINEAVQRSLQESP